jgi:MoaA/NifB/PqqE/SkfB family radical SAM enzyme
MKSKTSVFLFLTERCNLACGHCYVSSGPTRTPSMPIETVRKALDVFGAAGADDFRLIGGEPTIHPHYKEIIRNIVQRGNRVRLVSNGKQLFRDPHAKQVFALLDVCWISAYGTTPERHAQVAGKGALPLVELEGWIGQLASEGYRIGISVLLSPGDSFHVDGLLKRASRAGIRRVRLLPLEPDGRAALNPRTTWTEWPAEVQAIHNLIVRTGWNSHFDVLTLNDLFDVGGRFARGVNSCLLKTRRMWSLVPNGDIYSCCFNVYETGHKVGNLSDPRTNDLLSNWAIPTPEHPCRVFDDQYWNDGSPKSVTCPISSISFLSSESHLASSDKLS